MWRKVVLLVHRSQRFLNEAPPVGNQLLASPWLVPWVHQLSAGSAGVRKVIRALGNITDV